MKEKLILSIVAFLFALTASPQTSTEGKEASSPHVRPGITIKPLRDRCVVKYKGGWYFLNARLLTFEEYPELQKYITKELFGIESASIKDGYHQFVNSFDGIKSYREQSKAKGKEIHVTLQLPQGAKGRYLSLSGEYTTTDASQQTGKYLHLIFNEQTKTILTAEDILAEPYLTQLREAAQGAKVQFYTDKSGLNYVFKKDGQIQKQHVPYKDADAVFTDSFKALIVLKRLQMKSAENDS